MAEVVAPLAGAWIEIGIYLSQRSLVHVAPLAGAWIKMLSGVSPVLGIPGRFCRIFPEGKNIRMRKKRGCGWGEEVCGDKERKTARRTDPDENPVFDRRPHGRGENNCMPDTEKKTAEMCLSGRRLVLGYAPVFGDTGDKRDGSGKYPISARAISALFGI